MEYTKNWNWEESSVSAVEGLENYLLPILAIIGFVAVTIFVAFTTRSRRIFEDLFKFDKKIKTGDAETAIGKGNTEPLVHTEPTLVTIDVEMIKKELQAMGIEKEIVGYALTRLYEAEAQGKITEQDRIQLVSKYGDEMQRLNKEIEKRQMIVKLYDLEETRADVLKTFNSKLEDISRNIANIKAALGVSPTDLTQVKTQLPSSSGTQAIDLPTEEERTASRASVKSEAEERLAVVQDEVLKVLERLEQLEMEEGSEDESNTRSEEASSNSIGSTS